MSGVPVHQGAERTEVRFACRRCQAHTIVTGQVHDAVLICGVCGHEALGLRLPEQRGNTTR